LETYFDKRELDWCVGQMTEQRRNRTEKNYGTYIVESTAGRRPSGKVNSPAA